MSAFQHISPAQAFELLETGAVQVVDVRDPQSFAQARIPKAFHLTNDSVAEFVLHGEFELPVVVCCYHGISSQSAAAYLAGQGFDTVYSLDGGFTAWQSQYPSQVESDQ